MCLRRLEKKVHFAPAISERMHVFDLLLFIQI